MERSEVDTNRDNLTNLTGYASKTPSNNLFSGNEIGNALKNIGVFKPPIERLTPMTTTRSIKGNYKDSAKMRTFFCTFGIDDNCAVVLLNRTNHIMHMNYKAAALLDLTKITPGRLPMSRFIFMIDSYTKQAE
jgi:hypothetical protein